MLFLRYMTVTAFCLSTTFGFDITKPNGILDVASLTNLLVQMQQSIQSLQTSFSSQEQKYSSILSGVIATLKTRETELTNLGRDISQLQHGQQLIHDDLQEFSANMTTLVSEAAHLKSEVQTCDNNIASVLGDIQVLNSNSSSLMNQISALKQDVTGVRTNVDLVTTDLTGFKLDMIQIKSEVLHFRAAVNNVSAISLSVNGLRKSVTRVQSSIQLLNTSVVSVSTSQHSVQTSLTSIERSIAPVKTDVQRLKSDMTQVKTGASKASKDITSLRAAVNSHKVSLSAYQGSLHSLTSTQGSLSTELRQKESVIAKNTRDIATTRQQCTASVNSVKATLGTLGKSVAFQAKYTGGFGIGNRVIFNHVSLNTGSGYSATTGLFTAPVAGKYVFWLNIESTVPCGLYVGSRKVVDFGQGGTTVLSLQRAQTVSITKGHASYKLKASVTSFGGALL